MTMPDESAENESERVGGTPCIRCGPGEYRAGQTITVTRDRPGLTLVVKGVPASVCWACGESLMTEETTARLEEMLDEARSAGMETVIRRYSERERVEA